MKRLLVIRPGGIGDCILSLPALGQLRKHFEVHAWVPTAVVELYRSQGIASKSLTHMGMYALDTPAASKGLVVKFRDYDQIISWNSELVFQRFCAHLGVRDITFFDPLQECDEMHMADFFMWQCQKFIDRPVVTPINAIPNLYVPRLGTEDYMVIHPFSGSPLKNWGLVGFEDVAGMISTLPVWCAEPGVDWSGLAGRAKAMFPPCKNLYQLAHRLTAARCYLGNDSGVTHMAAALGIPTVALFRSTNPATWGPRGQYTRILAGKQITVENVKNLVEEALQYERNARCGNIPA